MLYFILTNSLLLIKQDMYKILVSKHSALLSSVELATRYLAHSMVGRGNLMLRLSVTHFPPNSGDIEFWTAELNAVRCFDNKAKKERRREENMKFFIYSSGDRAHDQSRLLIHATTGV